VQATPRSVERPRRRREAAAVRRRRRIEHWSNANYQGTEVGKVLAGAAAGAGGGYDAVSSFFSEVFGTTVKVFGDVSRSALRVAAERRLAYVGLTARVGSSRAG
jgi:hypothetical protein